MLRCQVEGPKYETINAVFPERFSFPVFNSAFIAAFSAISYFRRITVCAAMSLHSPHPSSTSDQSEEESRGATTPPKKLVHTVIGEAAMSNPG